MSQPKFTPGPYAVEHATSIHLYDIALAYNVPDRESPILIATVYCDEGSDLNRAIGVSEACANARLFAASPLMYEALLKASSCASIPDDVMELIRAALAKTRGSKR